MLRVERLAHAGIVGQRRAEVDRRRVLPVLVVEVDGEALIVEAGDAGRPRTGPPSSGWPRRSGATRCITSMSPERRLASRTLSSAMIRNTIRSNLRLARVEVVLGLLQDDPVLRDALDELSTAPRRPGRCRTCPRASWPAVGETGMPARSARVATIGENGAFRRSRTVRGSTTSIGGDRLQLAAPGGALHGEVAVERVPHRLGVHGRAVVELHARAQLDGHGLAAVGEARAGRRRAAGRSSGSRRSRRASRTCARR